MGVEVPQEESIILGVEEIIEGGRGIAGPGGDGRDVNIEDVEGSVVDGGPDCEVFCLGVIGEERVGVYGGVLDGVMDERKSKRRGGGERVWAERDEKGRGEKNQSEGRRDENMSNGQKSLK